MRRPIHGKLISGYLLKLLQLQVRIRLVQMGRCLRRS